MKMDEHIIEMFSQYWTGDYVLSSLDNMKAQLKKSLESQMQGYWSGHSAYKIMVDGGFLKDAKSGTKKELTHLGEVFINSLAA